MPVSAPSEAEDGACTFSAREELYKQQIADQRAQIATLRAALRVFARDPRENIVDMKDEGTEALDVDVKNEEKDNDEGESGYGASDDDDAENDREDAIWDLDCGLFRCPDCSWEIADGMCQNCGEIYSCVLPSGVDESAMQQSIPTAVENHALSSDRRVVHRGHTPVADVPTSRTVPRSYSGEYNGMYHALLARGATRLMCETFELEFTPKRGIFAWADQQLFDEFSGPAMAEGDSWKIYLGRRIVLDEDDLDGAQFIEDLLEEASLFPMRPYYLAQNGQCWETVKEQPGMWVTRPRMPREGEDARGFTSDTEGERSEDEDPYMEREQHVDAMLEDPYNENGEPAPLSNAYLSDSEGMSEFETREDMEMEDAGWTWEADVPDAVWEPNASHRGADDEEPEDSEEGEDYEPGQAMDLDSDSADTDFDEELSDDE